MKPRKAFFSLEYILVFGVIMIGLVSVFVILRQSIAGKYRSSADAFGEGRQFEPYGAHKTKETVEGGSDAGQPAVDPAVSLCCYYPCRDSAGLECPPCSSEETCFCYPIEPAYTNCHNDCVSKPGNYGC